MSRGHRVPSNRELVSFPKHSQLLSRSYASLPCLLPLPCSGLPSPTLPRFLWRPIQLHRASGVGAFAVGAFAVGAAAVGAAAAAVGTLVVVVRTSAVGTSAAGTSAVGAVAVGTVAVEPCFASVAQFLVSPLSLCCAFAVAAAAFHCRPVPHSHVTTV